MMTLEEAIEQFDEVANTYEGMADNSVLHSQKLYKSANEYKQLAEWLKILKKAKFEYDEAWRILTHPTPDVRYPDIDRTKMILDVFRDSLGRLNE